MKKTTTILAIETSCDETSLALIEASGGMRAPQFKILKHLVSSQVKIHAPFGGVVPNLAKREHLKNLPILCRKIFGEKLETKKRPSSVSGQMLNVDLIAVTVGPGLEPALWTGIEFAKKLRARFQVINPKLKIAGANHMEGHLYSFLLFRKQKTVISRKLFPSVALVVSGGHTMLLLLKDLTHWKKLGETRDDAAGEAFDKVGRLLGLPYPGGPEIEKIARKGNPAAIEFPRPMLNQKNYDFSFSGLKTSVLYFIRDNANSREIISGNKKSKNKLIGIADISASFQKAVIDVLTRKTFSAAKEFGAKSVILCGGVAANQLLRDTLTKEAKKIGTHFFAPHMEFNTDNAAMIAVAAYIGLAANKKSHPLKANGNLNI